MKPRSRIPGEPAAVTRTIVSPQRTTAAPPASLAHLPVSMEISLPPTMAESRTYGIANVTFRLGRVRGSAAWSFGPGSVAIGDGTSTETPNLRVARVRDLGSES